MIGQAAKLSAVSKEILIAYLHFLHMIEHLGRAGVRTWPYRTMQAHWIGAAPRAHWVGA